MAKVLGKILAIDYGSSKIGLALADEEVKIAAPLTVVYEKNFSSQIKKIKEIVIEESVSKLVVGLPLTKNGQESAQTKKVKEFVQNLKKVLGEGRTIYLEDERLSSRMGKKLLEEIRSGPEDAVAAAIILQGFLDRQQK